MSRPDNPDLIAPPVAIHLAFMLLGAGTEYLWPSDAGQGGIILVCDWRRGDRGWPVARHLGDDWPFARAAPGPSHGNRRPPWSTADPIASAATLCTWPLASSMSGIGFAAGSVWIIAGVVPTLVVMRLGVIGREERYLEAKFGETYLRYKQAVRRWL